ncbi:type II secretion system protein GspL [Craterilacuibacter sp.]|uniref:type II secretion system protein GspL n=1 Tax=Craterilacuibacter sp. TaxID=2870909 RepID=UPI003F411686
MTVLRLMLRSSWPDSEPGLAWALIATSGEQLQAGDDAPAHWPKSNSTELILPAGQTLFTRIKLPQASRERQLAAAGFALEEQLAGDPAANLYALGGMAGGLNAVAVTEAFALRRAVAMLKQLGRAPDRILPEEMCVPEPLPGQWVLARAAGGRILRRSHTQACVLPDGVVGDALAARLLAEGAPESQRLCGDVAALADIAQEKTEAAGWQTARGATPYDFARGELASNRLWRAWAPALKSSGLIVAVLIAAQLALLLGEAGMLAWRKHRLSSDIRTLTQPLLGTQALPGASALPLLRAVDRLRAERGEAVRDDALYLMARLGEASGNTLSLSVLESEGGRVALQAPALPDETFARMRTQLAGAGIALNKRSGEGGVREWILTREP